MKNSGEPVEAQAPITLVERQAFLPIGERRKIMAKQAREMGAHDDAP